MADGDAQFRMGVQHGFDDEPVYRWRDPFHQERYDAGYVLGQLQRASHDYEQPESPSSGRAYEAFQAAMKRRGQVRER